MLAVSVLADGRKQKAGAGGAAAGREA